MLLTILNPLIELQLAGYFIEHAPSHQLHNIPKLTSVSLLAIVKFIFQKKVFNGLDQHSFEAVGGVYIQILKAKHSHR